MSLRDEWVESANPNDWTGGKFFLTTDEVAELLASDECTDAQREWYANIKPLVFTRAVTFEQSAAFALRVFGNPLKADE